MEKYFQLQVGSFFFALCQITENQSDKAQLRNLLTPGCRKSQKGAAENLNIKSRNDNNAPNPAYAADKVSKCIPDVYKRQVLSS